MDNIVNFNPSRPRIRIIDMPLASENIPEWFLRELIGLTISVEAMIQGYTHFGGGELLIFKVSKKKLLRILQGKSRNAADLLKNRFDLFPEKNLCINSEVCEFLGSWKELRCETACAK